LSFLFKLRKVIHTTPVLRQVSKGFADAWGAGAAYKEFDEKIGYTESGEPVPSQDQYQGFGRSDLADMAAERYPQAAALVGTYRNYQRATGQARRPAIPPEPEDLGYEEDDAGDVGDVGDDEEEF